MLPKTPAPIPDPVARAGPARGRFVSVRTKFGVFLSLIIVVTCSGLSWYFIENKRTTTKRR
jgi:hypothetical protein